MEIFYRPKFCANCGERVERPEWHFWTSTRFCELCETEYKGREYAGRALLGVGLLGIAATVFAVLPNRSGTQGPQAVSAARLTSASAATVARQMTEAKPASSAETGVSSAQAQIVPAAPAANLEKQRQPVVASDPVYMCGAQTKKGTPCSRRVHGNIRCWQHLGMPAMLPADKLRVN